MKKFKYLIMAESYDENVGGCVVLHKLCDELNKLGQEAYLVPAYRTYFFNRNNLLRPALKFGKELLRRSKSYRTNPDWKTPVYKLRNHDGFGEEFVAIYPETITGNPLKAKNVTRWFLHHPGFHEPEYYYGVDELYFKYHSGINVPKSFLQNLSKLEMRIVSYPLHLYNTKGVGGDRVITTYAIRKGVGKPIVHDLSNSVLIDGLSHEEIAKLFKKSKAFISYDPYTAYSTFASLCGCDSIVIPDEGVDIDQWIPDKMHRAGISYGFEQISQARSERNLLLKRVADELRENTSKVQQFLSEISDFFNAKN